MWWLHPAKRGAFVTKAVCACSFGVHKMNLRIFSGVYQSFVESGGDREVFQSSVYLDHISSKLPQMRASNQAQYNQLHLLISILSSSKNELRVLDWGGGAGESFFTLKETAYRLLKKLFYYIVDNEKIIAVGKAFATTANRCKDVELKWVSLDKWEGQRLSPANIDIVQLGS